MAAFLPLQKPSGSRPWLPDVQEATAFSSLTGLRYTLGCASRRTGLRASRRADSAAAAGNTGCLAPADARPPERRLDRCALHQAAPTPPRRGAAGIQQCPGDPGAAARQARGAAFAAAFKIDPAGTSDRRGGSISDQTARGGPVGGAGTAGAKTAGRRASRLWHWRTGGRNLLARPAGTADGAIFKPRREDLQPTHRTAGTCSVAALYRARR